MRGAAQFHFGLWLGICPDQPATKLPDGILSDGQNVDLDGGSLKVRRGKKSLAAAPAAAPMRGGLAYYPSGATRSILAAAGTDVWRYTSGPGWSSILSGLVAGDTDFVQFGDLVYVGNGTDAVRKWTGSGSGSTLVAPTPPTGLTLVLAQQLLEGFNSGTVVTSVNANPAAPTITSSIGSTTPYPYEGNGYLQLEATAEGAEGDYAWHDRGGGMDLSWASAIELWARSNMERTVFKFGVYADTELPSSALDWKAWKSCRVQETKNWEQVLIPLDPVAPEERTLSFGWACLYIGSDNPTYGTPTRLKIDQARLHCRMSAGFYRYYATYVRYETIDGVDVDLEETSATSVAVIDIDEDTIFAGVTATVTGSLPTGWASGSTKVRLYRFREDSSFSRALSVAEAAFAASVAITDRMDDGELARRFATGISVRLVEQREIPPKATSYAAYGGRLWALDITVSSIRHRERLASSRIGFPEQFGYIPDVDDPASPGWADIQGEIGVRLYPHEGRLLVFCEQSVWSLEGSSWLASDPDPFRLKRRLNVGLDARWAVCDLGGFIFFFARDGVRVMSPRLATEDGQYQSWVISEPWDNALRAIPTTYRSQAAMEVDDLGRVQLSFPAAGATANNVALVLDTQVRGSTDPGENKARPGWTYYTNWGFRSFIRLRRGGGDSGQLLGGDATDNQVYFLGTDAAGADAYGDASDKVAWHATTRSIDAGGGMRLVPQQATILADAAAGEEFDVGLVGEDGAVLETRRVRMGRDASGAVDLQAVRISPDAARRAPSLKLSGSQEVAFAIRTAVLEGFGRY